MTDKTEKNRPNLFQPGQSGNPNGRPKGAGISITTAIKRELEKKPEGQDKSTYLDLLVKRIMKKAIQDGDQQTIKQVWNYVDGLPVAKVDVSGGFNVTTQNYANAADIPAPPVSIEITGSD